MKRLGLAAALLLAGCGKSLGEYRIDRISLANVDHLTTITDTRMMRVEVERPALLRLDLSSASDAIALSPTSSLEASIGTCPFGSSEPTQLFGPYPDDHAIFAINPVDPDAPANDQPREPGGPRHPQRDAAGRYHYTAYLPLHADAVRMLLRQDSDRLCLRLNQVGYVFAASTSDVFDLDHKAVVDMLMAGRDRRALRFPPQSPK